MEELQNRVSELEAKLQERDCMISSLQSENRNLRQWWMEAQARRDTLIGALESVVNLAKGK